MEGQGPAAPAGPGHPAPRFGVLYLVATPIGNLEDITLRALRILKEAGVVAAEDTRRTGRLLQHYHISTPLLSVHAHNEGRRIEAVCSHLRAGRSVALVSDAGTPGISDPGAAVVAAARASGFRIEPIPGPSAVTAAMSVSGIQSDGYVFAAFPPIKAKDRNLWFERLAQVRDRAVVCFEAPHRIHATLAELRERAAGRSLLIGREVTKLHEEWIASRTEAVDPDRVPERGEFVLVIGPVEAPLDERDVKDDDVWTCFGQITDSGVATSRREAIRATADRLGLSANAVFAALERHKNSTV